MTRAYPFNVIKYGSRKNPSRKSKVSQDQLDWLMMELQTMREYNATLQNNQRSKTTPAGNN